MARSCSKEGAGGSGAEGAAIAGEGRGRQGGDPPVARRLMAGGRIYPTAKF